MPILSLLLRLGLGLMVAYVLGVKVHAADDGLGDGPKIDISPPPIIASLASADTAPVTPAEDVPTVPERLPLPEKKAATAQIPATAAASGLVPTQEQIPPDAAAIIEKERAAAKQAAGAVVEKTPPPSPTDPNPTLMAREADLVKQGEKQVLEREAQIIDPLREILLREASLIAGVKEKANTQEQGPKIDRVTFADRLVLNHDFRMAKNLLQSIITSSGVSEEERAKSELLLAKIDLYENHSSDAVVKLSSWLAQYPRRPESPFIYYLLGQAYRDLGVYELARDNFYRVMSGTLMNATASTSESYDKEKRLVRAAVWQLAETEYMHRHWDRALTYFDRFYNQNPSGDQLVEASLYRKADCQFQMRHESEAITGYEKAIAVAPFHPFAPEAWLRLYFLYGDAKQPKKQAEAMQALTWLVKNLQPDRQAYWQQRAVAMIMELPLENRSQLVALRDGLRTRADDPSWKPLYGYLNELSSRLTLDRPDHSTLPTSGAPQSADEWAQWKNDYTRKRDKLQEEAKSLLQRQPVNAPVQPRAVPTQG